MAVHRAQRPGNPRRKYLGLQHFTGNVDVLSYSLSKCGIYCRPCAIFAPNEVRRMNLNRIVKTPLQKYTHLTGKNGYLKKHLSKQLHEDSLSRSNAFVSIIKSNVGDVEQQGKVGAAKQREKTEGRWRGLFFHRVFGAIGPSSSRTPCFRYFAYASNGFVGH